MKFNIVLKNYLSSELLLLCYEYNVHLLSSKLLKDKSESFSMSDIF